MHRSIRRFAVTAAATGGLLVAAAAPALAHECYNTQRSATGNAAAAGSNGWATFASEVAEFIPPASCPAGVQLLAAAAGITPDTLILQHATMASGTANSPHGPGTPAISYLNFGALDAAVPDAIAACS